LDDINNGQLKRSNNHAAAAPLQKNGKPLPLRRTPIAAILPSVCEQLTLQQRKMCKVHDQRPSFKDHFPPITME
jgi:hypothetical protein